jgi:hypothetical protein
MGFLKKITRPISRVLDKIVPNEIKPALPFLAAAAPFMAPGIMGIGGNTMLSRALISGGLNLGGQLAQEGSEGDFNALSLALASGIGALSAPGTQPTTARGDLIKKVPDFSMSAPGEGPAMISQRFPGMGAERVVSAGTPSAGEYLRNLSDSGGITDQALNFLGSGADKLKGLSEGLAADGIFSKAGAKALSIPFTQGTMDLAVADTRRFNKQQIIDDALGALEEGADSASRALAIRNAMESYGFTEDEILSTIESAGYRAGGRVGLKGGGMDAREMNISEPGIMGNPAVMEKIENMREFMIANPDIEDITDYSEKYESKDPDFEGIKGAIKSIDVEEEKEQLDDMGDLMAGMGNTMSLFETPYGFDRSGFEDMLIQFEDSGAKGKGIKLRDFAIEFLNMVKKDKPQTTMKAKDGGLMNLGGKEMDLRKGGFVPIGKKERADDVPARLSKNEFVMTADAVRAAGGGSVNEGAKRMYDVMNKLEARA